MGPSPSLGGFPLLIPLTPPIFPSPAPASAPSISVHGDSSPHGEPSTCLPWTPPSPRKSALPTVFHIYRSVFELDPMPASNLPPYHSQHFEDRPESTPSEGQPFKRALQGRSITTAASPLAAGTGKDGKGKKEIIYNDYNHMRGILTLISRNIIGLKYNVMQYREL